MRERERERERERVGECENRRDKGDNRVKKGEGREGTRQVLLEKKFQTQTYISHRNGKKRKSVSHF